MVQMQKPVRIVTSFGSVQKEQSQKYWGWDWRTDQEGVLECLPAATGEGAVCRSIMATGGPRPPCQGKDSLRFMWAEANHRPVTGSVCDRALLWTNVQEVNRPEAQLARIKDRAPGAVVSCSPIRKHLYGTEYLYWNV